MLIQKNGLQLSFAKNGGVGKQSHLLIPLGTRELVAQLIFLVGRSILNYFFTIASYITTTSVP
jgi:hypothetical protein